MDLLLLYCFSTAGLERGKREVSDPNFTFHAVSFCRLNLRVLGKQHPHIELKCILFLFVTISKPSKVNPPEGTQSDQSCKFAEL